MQASIVKLQVNAHGCLHDFDPKKGWGEGAVGGVGVCLGQAIFGA